jgi:hypothetical protein
MTVQPFFVGLLTSSVVLLLGIIALQLVVPVNRGRIEYAGVAIALIIAIGISSAFSLYKRFGADQNNGLE